MLAHFIHRITTKICRLGYARKRARFLAVVVTGWMITVIVLTGIVRVVQDDAGDGKSGRSTGYCGQIIALHYYAPFGIQR